MQKDNISIVIILVTLQSTNSTLHMTRHVFKVKPQTPYYLVVWPPKQNYQGFAVAEIRECKETGKV
jgi:hypothetical protein